MKDLTGNYTPGTRTRVREKNELWKLILTIVLLAILFTAAGLVKGIL